MFSVEFVRCTWGACGHFSGPSPSLQTEQNLLFQAIWYFGYCECQLTTVCLTGRWCGDDTLYYYHWCALILQYCRHIAEVHCTCIQSDVINKHTFTGTSSPLWSLPVCEGRVHITKPDLTVTNSLEGTQECAVDIQSAVAVYLHIHRQYVIYLTWNESIFPLKLKEGMTISYLYQSVCTMCLHW